MIHDLKILTEHMEDIDQGRKTFEVRLDDREYSQGDTLRLHEWNPEKHFYTGRGLHAYVKMIHRGLGMRPGYAVMALGTVERIGDWHDLNGMRKRAEQAETELAALRKRLETWPEDLVKAEARVKEFEGQVMDLQDEADGFAMRVPLVERFRISTPDIEMEAVSSEAYEKEKARADAAEGKLSSLQRRIQNIVLWVSISLEEAGNDINDEALFPWSRGCIGGGEQTKCWGRKGCAAMRQTHLYGEPVAFRRMKIVPAIQPNPENPAVLPATAGTLRTRRNRNETRIFFDPDIGNHALSVWVRVSTGERLRLDKGMTLILPPNVNAVLDPCQEDKQEGSAEA